MTLPIVFIASSSEGLGIVDKVQERLQLVLGGTAKVSPWPGRFQLTKTYIESLEGLLEESDFAVFVLTPDDSITSRNAERWSPRDNVVFELGLFFGRLGRARCFIIQPGDFDLKLPSDLLGIEPATFSIFPGQGRDTALDPACTRIGEAIRNAMTALPRRPRLDSAERAVQTKMHSFRDQIAGTWWERIELEGEEPALSFFTIGLDDIHSSVRLDGKAYNADGHKVAEWESAAARLEDRRIVYVRKCQRSDAKTTAWLPGLAEVQFTVFGDGIDQGNGKFWESDESRPEDTVVKLVELRRNLDESHALTMGKGSAKDREALVKQILESW